MDSLAVQIFGPATERANLPTPTEPLLDPDKELLDEIVTQIEIDYWRTSAYSAQEDLEYRFRINGDKLKELSPRINKVLRTRGLPVVKFVDQYISSANKVPEADLNKTFVVAVNLICDTLDKRSRSAKLKLLGLSSKEFNAYLKNPAHREYYVLRINNSFKDADESAKLSLIRNIEAGDLQSIKYYYEFTGIHDPNKETVVNLNKIINLLMEILIRHVTPDVIEAVGREFDTKLLELER
jgi:hypothetical protein